MGIFSIHSLCQRMAMAWSFRRTYAHACTRYMGAGKQPRASLVTSCQPVLGWSVSEQTPSQCCQQSQWGDIAPFCMQTTSSAEALEVSSHPCLSALQSTAFHDKQTCLCQPACKSAMPCTYKQRPNLIFEWHQPQSERHQPQGKGARKTRAAGVAMAYRATVDPEMWCMARRPPAFTSYPCWCSVWSLSAMSVAEPHVQHTALLR